jgi:hypothetical protein
LQPGRAIRFQPPLYRVADVGRDITEIGPALGIARHAFPIIPDGKIEPAMLAPPRDGDGTGLGVDAVLNQLGDCLERTALRERDDGDGIPVIANLQPPAPAARRTYVAHVNRISQGSGAPILYLCSDENSLS